MMPCASSKSTDQKNIEWFVCFINITICTWRVTGSVWHSFPYERRTCTLTRNVEAVRVTSIFVIQHLDILKTRRRTVLSFSLWSILIITVTTDRQTDRLWIRRYCTSLGLWLKSDYRNVYIKPTISSTPLPYYRVVLVWVGTLWYRDIQMVFFLDQSKNVQII